MDTASWLTDVYGGRLTGSPNIKAAGDWAVKKLTEWGAPERSPRDVGRFRHRLAERRASRRPCVTPDPWTIIGAPKAWTPGTDGPVTADAVYAPMTTDADLERWKGKLKGKIVLAMPIREVKASFDPLAKRYTDDELKKLEEIDPSGGPRRQVDRSQFTFAAKRLQFLADEGVLASFEPSRGGDGGTIFVQQGGAYRPHRAADVHPLPRQRAAAGRPRGRALQPSRAHPRQERPGLDRAEHQERTQPNQTAFNVIAELPGTDKADEVVMLGAHFDSWHSGTGATDNGAGSAIMMEAFRILKASGVKLRRTVRIALWSGEEEGLLGSRAYVKNTFADRETMALKPAQGKITGYFNVDNGTGAIRGVYLQGNEAVESIFKAWMEPFKSLGMTTLTLQNTGGTDHLSFDAVGIPGFQFVQDELEYDSRTHHSNMDVYDRLQTSDMMKNAVIVASFVYDAANRDQMLPRKPLPKAAPPAGQTAPARATN